MESKEFSRRQFLGTTALAVAGLALAPPTLGAPAILKNLGKPNSLFNGVQVGVISYSFRSMPSSAEQILQYCLDCNISALELMGPAAETFAGAPAAPAFNGQRGSLTPEQQAERAAYGKQMAEWRASAPMKRFEQLRKMYQDAGVRIYAYKPSALGANNTDAEVDYALRAAKALGATHVTVELPGNADQTRRLGEIAARHKVQVGYHGHLQQTFNAWDTALEQSAYNALNFDLGHYVAAGHDPIPLLQKHHARIASMHTKDRRSKANGGANVPWGQGDTPIAEVLQLMRKQKYAFPATIELEYEIPAGSDAVKETAKCVEFARKALGA